MSTFSQIKSTESVTKKQNKKKQKQNQKTKDKTNKKQKQNIYTDIKETFEELDPSVLPLSESISGMLVSSTISSALLIPIK